MQWIIIRTTTCRKYLQTIDVINCSRVVCTDHSGKEPPETGTQVVKLGNLGGVMVSTLDLNANDVDSIPAYAQYFPFS